MSKLFCICIVALFATILPLELTAAIELKSTDQPVLELFALVLGGIGIFLTGIHFAGTHLQKITGGTFRNIISKISENQLGVFLWGIFLGMFTQSGKATAFILADFVQAGMIKVRRCAPVVFWGNAGSSLIVFASMLSVKILALIILGITALGITFHFPKRLVNAYGALFGLAMIMYGLYLVKVGAAGFAGFEGAQRWLDYMGSFPLLGFVAGFVLTLLVQSNVAIMMITIALTAAGILTLEEAAMGIYGAQAGTGLLTYIFSFHSKGRPRQVVAYQIAFDITATITFVLLFYLETLLGIPLILALSKSISANPGTQAVSFALIFQFGAATIALFLRRYMFQYVEDRFRPSAVEVLSETEFLHDKVAESPETGLILAEQEQFRLMKRLPRYIDYVREEDARHAKEPPSAYHQAFMDISHKIGNTLSLISGHSLSPTDSDQLIKVTKLQEQLVMLEDIVYRLTGLLAGHDLNSRAGQLGRSIMESIDFIILTAVDAIESQTESEIDTLDMLTQDRTDMMDRFRRNYFNTEQELSRADRNLILDVTILFENAIQTLARYGSVLKNS
jgi:phosphate:Na+ symporter